MCRAQGTIGRSVARIQLHSLVKIRQGRFKLDVYQQLVSGEVGVHVTARVQLGRLDEFRFGLLRLPELPIGETEEQVRLVVLFPKLQ